MTAHAPGSLVLARRQPVGQQSLSKGRPFLGVLVVTSALPASLNSRDVGSADPLTRGDLRVNAERSAEMREARGMVLALTKVTAS